MDKQKRELAWLIFQEADCSLSGEDCSIIADLLINKGYRKQSNDVVEVRRGRWLPQRLLGEDIMGCSECKTIGSPRWKWCPVCGADMRGEKNGNT